MLVSYSKLRGIYHIEENKRYRFNEEHGTLEIIKTKKEDEGEYELVVLTSGLENVNNLHIEIYELISNLSIDMTQNQENASCLITLNCTLQSGDRVTYSWIQNQEVLNTNSSVLQITVTSDTANSTYTCKASNPVSENTTVATPWMKCNFKTEQTKHSFLVYAVVITVVALLFFLLIILWRHYSKKTGKHVLNSQGPAPREEPEPQAVNTVYSTVQKPQPPISPVQTTQTVYELAGPVVKPTSTHNVAPC
ncbi:signaling lymphocytic activation molecule isoform X2 [Bombina bombina]|uniref:signaling lymphocytic activation molecule isoform X2 n=1 Tax=Bombina bombina TaxID=8345 RepID=UPI00235A6AE5|nr:signaling lymphocytic activation molecule isoform X2 [Bombina bombina]